MECLSNLVGLKELCAANAIQPYFYLDDAEGLDRTALAQLTKPSNGSGLAFGNEIIEAGSRFLMADIETIVPKGYSIKSSLNSFCNTCTYTGLTTSLPETGIIIKNTATTKNGYLSLDSLNVKIANTGTFNIVIHDGVEAKLIEADFTAGVEKQIINISYKTSAKSIKLYFLESDIFVYALNCPTTQSCGCSGSTTNKDLQVKGLYAGTEFTTQYGFIPCASVVCSIDNVICSIINQQPKLFALALFYRSVARYFSEFQTTQRNNRNASFNEEEKTSLSDRYMILYYERLQGSANVKGIADNLAASLNSLNDACIECSRRTSTAWAVG